MRYFILPLILLITLTAQAQRDSEVRLLAKWISGTYTTEGETIVPPRTAHQSMRIVRIWEELDDLWLYLEQSDLTTPDQPHRQWVFWVDKQGEHLMLEMNLLDDTLKVPGNLPVSELEKYLDIDAMTVADGCEIFLTYDGFAVFSGATVQNYCELSLRDESYITIRMNISENQIDWWEYGMQPGGAFVWGSAENQQAFIKRK